MRYFNSIVEAAENIGVNTQIVRWLLENNHIPGENQQGRWSIPVDGVMQKKEDGSLETSIALAKHAIQKARPRRHKMRYSRRNTHRSYKRAH